MKWRRARCSTRSFTRRTITLPPPPGAGHTPIGLITLGDEITPPSISWRPPSRRPNSRPSMLDGSATAPIGRASPCPTRSPRWIDRLLGDLGVIVFECSDRAAKPLASRDLRPRDRTSRHARGSWRGEAGERLAAGGYHAQVEALAPRRRGAVPAERRAHGRSRSTDAAGLGTRTRRRVPRRSARTCCLRPIVEDTLFPTICYVSGPNELAYLAQLREVYEHFGVPMPLFYPPCERDDSRLGERTISREARPAVRSAAGAATSRR